MSYIDLDKFYENSKKKGFIQESALKWILQWRRWRRSLAP